MVCPALNPFREFGFFPRPYSVLHRRDKSFFIIIQTPFYWHTSLNTVTPTANIAPTLRTDIATCFVVDEMSPTVDAHQCSRNLFAVHHNRTCLFLMPLCILVIPEGVVWIEDHRTGSRRWTN